MSATTGPQASDELGVINIGVGAHISADRGKDAARASTSTQKEVASDGFALPHITRGAGDQVATPFVACRSPHLPTTYPWSADSVRPDPDSTLSTVGHLDRWHSAPFLARP
jgi:hypothetical protein